MPVIVYLVPIRESYLLNFLHSRQSTSIIKLLSVIEENPKLTAHEIAQLFNTIITTHLSKLLKRDQLIPHNLTGVNLIKVNMFVIKSKTHD